MGPTASLDGCGKSRSHRDSIPGQSSPWRVAIPTELSRPLYMCGIVGYVALKGDREFVWMFLVRRHEGKRSLGRPRRRWDDDIEKDL